MKTLPGLVVATALVLAPGGLVPTLDAQAGRTDCAALASLRLPDVRITEATAVPAATTGAVRAAHCRVDGIISTEIRFSVLLPDDWNGRFFMGGGGGFVGTIQNSAAATVNLGFATAGTDTGHQADGTTAAWALDNVERQVNFGHVAVHRTAEVAKAIIRARYGSDSQRNYFSGCSRGGGQGVMEAIRYPDDFDGIVAGAPAIDWSGVAAQFVKDSQAAFPDPASPQAGVLPPATLQFVEARILAACDAIDGVRDGVMNDPRQCTFNLDSLPACSTDAGGGDCVTTRQRAALAAIYAPTRNREGQIQPGQPFGGEGHPQGWPTWITGTGEMAAAGVRSLRFAFGTELFKYFVFADPTWDYSRYDFSTWKRDTRAVAATLDATDPNLDRFKQRNGKLIVWHGWSDTALSALRSIDYYDAVQARDSGANAYARLFLMPGVLHCGGGPGPDTVDWVEPIVDWVERGRAPGRVIARTLIDGKATRTRPLCPYPQRAEYSGSGSTDDDASFVCR